MDKNTLSEFRTKVGICTLTPEQITFSKGAPASARGSSRAALLGVLFASLLFGFGVFLFLTGEMLLGALWVMLGLALRWQQVRAGSAAPPPGIPRAAIRKIEAHAPLWLLMAGYFVVWFEMDGKKFRQRIVVQAGKSEYTRAVEALRAAGLLQE